jgi:hypothetical protein
MNIKATIRLVAAESTAIAINLIPVALWFLEDYPAEATMIIYAVECGVAIGLAVLLVLIVSPSYDASGSPKYKRKGKLVADFLIISLGLLAATAAFIIAFLFLVLKATVDLSVIGWALFIVIAFQLGEFLVDLLTLRPLPLKKAEALLTRSMGRTALLFLCIFIGLFLAAFVNEWFLVPFIVLKTVVDIGEPIQFFVGRGAEVQGMDAQADLIT